jgi:carboxymethylenebutenolidase
MNEETGLARSASVLGYAVRPAGGDLRPGVLVIHEAFGLNQHIREACDRIARAGFAVVAPDLYQGRPDRLATYEERDKAIAMLKSLQDAEVLATCDRAADHLRSAVGARPGPVGVVGFRIGGRYALLWPGERPGAAGAVVSYYGPGIAGGTLSTGWTINALESACAIEAPVLLFFVGADQTVSGDEVTRIEARLRSAGRHVTVVRYPGLRPGFAFPGRDTYAPAEGEDAWDRTLRLLQEHRSGPGPRAR